MIGFTLTPVSRCRRLALALLALALASPLPGMAQQARQVPLADAVAVIQAPLLPSTGPLAERVRGVGKFKGYSNCTASLVAASHTPPADSPALILTAGHCLEFFGEQEVWVDRPANAEWRYTPAYFHDTPQQHIGYPVERVLYATMKGADVAVLRLQATYGELAARGIAPLLMRPLDTATALIDLVQVPQSGIPAHEQFLRHAQCSAAPRQAIFESAMPWFWPQAVPNDCAGVAGGSSGSPVLLRDTATVVGVLNTTVERYMNGCGLGRPCEVDPSNRKFARESASYFTTVEALAGQVREDGSFDLHGLDDGRGIGVSRALHHFWATQSRVPDAQGNLQPATWGLRLDEGFEQVRFKHGPVRGTDCQRLEDYGQPLPVAAQPLLALPMPAAEGIYTACILGKRAGAAWQVYPTVVLGEVDDTPPTGRPRVNVRDTEKFWMAIAHVAPNEILSAIVKYGPLGEVDCAAPEGYRRQLNNHYAQLDKARAWRFCARGLDLPDNLSTPAQQDFRPGDVFPPQ